MSPYRPAFLLGDPIEPRTQRAGYCPWCRAPVSFAAAARTAVCAACGAAYASSLALTTEKAASPTAPSARRTDEPASPAGESDVRSKAIVVGSVAAVAAISFFIWFVSAFPDQPHLIVVAALTTMAAALLAGLVRGVSSRTRH
jgi:hypothetical protein